MWSPASGIPRAAPHRSLGASLRRPRPRLGPIWPRAARRPRPPEAPPPEAPPPSPAILAGLAGSRRGSCRAVEAGRRAASFPVSSSSCRSLRIYLIIWLKFIKIGRLRFLGGWGRAEFGRPGGRVLAPPLRAPDPGGLFLFF